MKTLKGQIPNLFTAVRLFLLPVLWLLAWFGQLPALGLGILVAGLTDVADGYLARRWRQVSAFGARFDSVADHTLLISMVVWLFWYQRPLFNDHPAMMAIVLSLGLLALVIGLLKFRRFANLHIYSAKFAGVMTYTMVVHAFLTGSYHPILFTLAWSASVLSATESILLLLLHDQVDEHMGSLLLSWRRRGRHGSEGDDGLPRGEPGAATGR